MAAVFRSAATGVGLLHGANAAGLSGAACLPGTGVNAVASTVSRHYVGEGVVEAFRFSVDSVTKRQSVLRGIDEDTFDGPE